MFLFFFYLLYIYIYIIFIFAFYIFIFLYNLFPQLIDGFLKEMSSIFTDNIVHLGGDEVDADCWFEDASILSWMSEKNFTTSLEVSIYFAHAVSSIGKAQGKNLMFWEEAFTDGVGIPTDSIVEVWRDQAVLQDVVSSGYKGVTSASWYLDRQVPGECIEF